MELTKKIVIEGPLIVAQNVDYSDHPQLGPLLAEGWQVQTITRSFGRDPVVELTKATEPSEGARCTTCGHNAIFHAAGYLECHYGTGQGAPERCQCQKFTENAK